MQLYWRKKVLVAALEDTYGVDAGPGAGNALHCINVGIRPMEGQDVDRGHDTPWLGASGTIPADLHMVMTFTVELVGSGVAGTAPQFAPVLRSLGLAETITANTSVQYNPISGGFDSATYHLNIDGILFALVGARGDANVVVNASGIPMLECTVTGLWTKPTDQVAVTPNLSGLQKPQVASKANTPTFTINGTPHEMRSFTLAMGNEVEGRFLVGKDEIVIVDRSDSVTTQIEADALSTLDPFALARDQETVALALNHGTADGRRVAFAVPAAQVMRPGAPTEAQGIMEWPLNLRPLPVTGNDQWTLTFT
ncbi:phage tail tube protein [uncultured Tateyamaria sp.]|uniref:phage tail tube protein n=1 Tax=uncultured Tateyamaria sp. TaxID=455651 RepID=UPI0026387782|nr:phage tail tube protein [uncultured Tateyamaria sp.]